MALLCQNHSAISPGATQSICQGLIFMKVHRHFCQTIAMGHCTVYICNGLMIMEILIYSKMVEMIISAERKIIQESQMP